MQGPIEYKILSQVKKRRLPIPRQFANPPTLLPGLGIYKDAFWALITCRLRAGWPIPWTAVDAYCNSCGIPHGESRDLMHEYVRAMDIAFLKHTAQKTSSDRETGGGQDGKSEGVRGQHEKARGNRSPKRP